MRHLTRDDMLEAIEAAPSKWREAPWSGHLHGCDACRREVEELRALMGEAGSLPVPEPSPLFWEGFSRRIGEAVREQGKARSGAEEQQGGAWWRRLLTWQVAMPGAAVAAVLLLLAAVTLLPGLRGTTARPPAPQAAHTATTPSDAAGTFSAGPTLSVDEESWGLLSDLLADGEDASVLLPATPGTAEQAVLQLSDEERGELGRLLQAEIDRARPRGEG